MLVPGVCLTLYAGPWCMSYSVRWSLVYVLLCALVPGVCLTLCVGPWCMSYSVRWSLVYVLLCMLVPGVCLTLCAGLSYVRTYGHAQDVITR